MKRFFSSISATVAIAVAALTFSNAAQATMWSIDEVLSGTDGGYGFSSFHDASTGSVMSGVSLGAISGSGGGLGLFDDVTGAFTLTATSGGGSTTFNGVLDFGGVFGFLSTPSSMMVNFAAPAGLLQNADITFEAGDVCCNGNGNATPGDDPNSFVANGANGAIITLWGANAYNGGYDNGAYNPNDANYLNNRNGPTTLGMDLRVSMTRVPEPGMVFLLGIGLLGVAVSRRATRA